MFGKNRGTSGLKLEDPSAFMDVHKPQTLPNSTGEPCAGLTTFLARSRGLLWRPAGRKAKSDKKSPYTHWTRPRPLPSGSRLHAAHRRSAEPGQHCRIRGKLLHRSLCCTPPEQPIASSANQDCARRSHPGERERQILHGFPHSRRHGRTFHGAWSFPVFGFGHRAGWRSFKAEANSRPSLPTPAFRKSMRQH